MGSMSTVSKGAAETDCVGLSDVSSAICGGGAGEERDEMEDEEELELGLSLGAKKLSGGEREATTGTWGERCRILTAEDFPSSASPRSSSSSVCSSSARLGGGLAAATKRDVGSTNPSSQVVVGWPPIRSYRINNLVNQYKDNTSDSYVPETKNACIINHNNLNETTVTKEQEKRSRLSGRSHFVKVNMDGDLIGRKVNLGAHLSYDTLAIALEDMFLKPGASLDGTSLHGTTTSRLLDGASEFVLTYEDKDGDWMLVGDVPWGMFLSTVKRLRIMRNSDANGFGKSLQSNLDDVEMSGENSPPY